MSGLFYRDMRHLSRWQMRLNGRELDVLSADTLDYDEAVFFLIEPTGTIYRNPTLSLVRHRHVGDGMQELLDLTNHGTRPIQLEVSLLFGADFADIFEIKDKLSKTGEFARRVLHRRVADLPGQPRPEPDVAERDGDLPGHPDPPAGTAPLAPAEHGREPGGVAGGRADAGDRLRRPAPHLPPQPGRPRRPAVLPGDRAGLVAARGRAALVHGAVRAGQPDHQLPGAAVRPRAVPHHAARAGQPAGHRVRRLPRRRARQDPARAAPRRADPLRQAAAVAVLRLLRLHPAVPGGP